MKMKGYFKASGVDEADQYLDNSRRRMHGCDEGAWLRPDTQWRKLWIPFALLPISPDAIRRSLDTASFVLAWQTGRAE